MTIDAKRLAEIRQDAADWEHNNLMLVASNAEIGELVAIADKIAKAVRNEMQIHIAFNELYKECIKMEAEIKRLQCCGNCKAYRFMLHDMPRTITKSIIDGKIVYNADSETPVIEMICYGADGSEKCDAWEERT
jgi:hypothetical protein